VVRIAPERPPRHPLRVAIVSNHVAPDVAEAIRLLENAGEIEADTFGLEWKSVAIDGDLLIKYDAVLAIGRTALLAAACGVPCVMADIHGSDGLLTADNLHLVRTANFSGRLSRQRSSAAHLQGEFAKLAGLDRRRLRDRISGYSLQARVDWLLARYDELLARHAAERPLPSPRMNASIPVPSEGLVYAEMVAVVRKLESSAYSRSKAWARANIVVLRRLRRTLTLAMKRAIWGTRRPESRLTNAIRSAPRSWPPKQPRVLEND
jgi:hypothetical protein